MNILLTCVGRRDYLVEYFRAAVAGKGRVFGANSIPATAGMMAADEAFVVSHINEPSYIDELVSICRAHNVGLVVPLLDHDVAVLSHHKAAFAAVGAVLAAASPRTVEICTDKWKTFCFARDHGIATAHTCLGLDEARRDLDNGTLVFPVFLKPRWGMGSVGITRVDSLATLQPCYERLLKEIDGAYFNTPKPTDHELIVIQETLPGAEYGLDVFNDLDGKYLTTLAKRKLEMRAGETDRAITEDSSQLRQFGESLGAALGHVGNLDVDVIMKEGQPHLLELNPRFGGHYPFAHVAGANLPAALVSLAAGRRPDPDWLTMRSDVSGVKGICVRCSFPTPPPEA